MKSIRVSSPKVIKFGCKNFETVGSNQRAVCSFCKEKTVITDRIGVTSNFLKYLQRIHTDKYVLCLLV